MLIEKRESANIIQNIYQLFGFVVQEIPNKQTFNNQKYDTLGRFLSV